MNDSHANTIIDSADNIPIVRDEQGFVQSFAGILENTTITVLKIAEPEERVYFLHRFQPDEFDIL